MIKRSTLTGAVALMAAALPAPAQADPGDVVCTIKARKSYSLAEARGRGMPVYVTCDRSTVVFSVVNIAANDPANKFVNFKAHPHTHGWSRPRTIEAGQPARFRPRLQPFAARAIQKAGGAKVYLGLGIKQADGRYHNNPNTGGYVGARVRAGTGSGAAMP